MRNHKNGLLGAWWLCTAAIVALMLTGASACRPANEGGDAMPQRDINAVKEAHVNELMAIPKVVGVAVGALDDGTPCILVLVVEETDEIDRRVPKKLEGHPVRVFVSGEIKPMDSD